MAKKARRSDVEKVSSIVFDAGGRVVGRTRLQKLVYLLEVAGFGEGFPFEYRHYGPYSEQLAVASNSAALSGAITQEDRRASWGGTYSVFATTQGIIAGRSAPRSALAAAAARANPVALELAATAVFLSKEGTPNPWGETARLKPEKAGQSLPKAKALYASLRRIAPTLPPIHGE